jgi:hypothetical protein
VAVFRFFCDESYDSDPKTGTGMPFYTPGIAKPSYVPRIFVVAGFFCNELQWNDVEARWRTENIRAGVKRYHGAHVNARTGEFDGWSKEQQIEYSKNLTAILLDQGRCLHAISCAMWSSDYYRIIDEEGRRKLGIPYIACFKSCIALIAQEMEIRGFPSEDKFAVILDPNEWEDQAIEVFYKMKDTAEWPYRHRLATCAPGSTEGFVPLESADLIAYETFRLIYYGATGDKIRKVLRSMFSTMDFLAIHWTLRHYCNLKNHLLQACAWITDLLCSLLLLTAKPRHFQNDEPSTGGKLCHDGSEAT